MSGMPNGRRIAACAMVPASMKSKPPNAAPSTISTAKAVTIAIATMLPIVMAPMIQAYWRLWSSPPSADWVLSAPTVTAAATMSTTIHIDVASGPMAARAICIGAERVDACARSPNS
jgi:hypothetical protein